MNPSSSRGAGRRAAAQKFPRNSDGEQIFSEKQMGMRCTSRRRIMQQMDSLGRDQRQSAGENAPSGRGNSQNRRRVYARSIKKGGALDNAAPFAVQ